MAQDPPVLLPRRSSPLVGDPGQALVPALAAASLSGLALPLLCKTSAAVDDVAIRLQRGLATTLTVGRRRN